MKMNCAIFASLLCLLVVFPAAADVIPVLSQGVVADPLETNTVPIATVAGWMVPAAGATWVSYANTGAGGFSPANGTTATFTQTFSLPYSANTGSVTVWADDTADVSLDGVLIYAANLGAAQGTCQMGVIGCLPVFGGPVDLTGLSAGTHVLSVTAHQIGGDGFGALWQGSVNSVPEPTTILLLIGVIGVYSANKAMRGRKVI